MGQKTTGQLLLRISANSSQFLRESKRTRQSMGRMKSSSDRLKTSVVSMAKTAGAAMATYFSARALMGVVNTLAGFADKMSEVKAISGATAEEFQALRNQALELGRTTRFTASEVAGLETEYSRLGFATDQILKMTKATLNLASISKSELGDAAKVVGSTIRAFNLEASESKRVVDVMAASFSASALDMEKFSVAMGNVAPIARNMGLSLEQTTAMLAQLVDRGIDASTASTGLRGILLDLTRHGFDLTEAFDMINSSMNKVNTEAFQKLIQSGVSSADAFDQINNSIDKTSKAFQLFQKRGALVATILAETQTETAKLTNELLSTGDAAQRMADIMEDNLAGDIRELKSAFEGSVLEASKFNEALRIMVQLTTDLVRLLPQIGEALIDEVIGPWQTTRDFWDKFYAPLIEQIKKNKTIIKGQLQPEGFTQGETLADRDIINPLSVLGGGATASVLPGEGAGTAGDQPPSVTPQDFEALLSQMGNVEQAGLGLIAMWEANAIATGEYNRAINEIVEGGPEEEIVKMVSGLRKMQQTSNTIVTGLSSVGSAFTQMGARGASAILRLIAQTVQLIVTINALKVAQAQASLAGGAAAAGGLLGPIGAALGIGIGLISLFAGKKKKVPKFANFAGFGNASGTNNFRGGIGLVGERGPELVQMPRGAKIKSNAGLGGGGDDMVIEHRFSMNEFILELRKANDKNKRMGGVTI